MEQKDDKIRRHLEDAGCCCEVVDNYCHLEKTCCCKEQELQEKIRLLAHHRSQLLEELHDCQNRLECLDHLLHKLKQEQKDCKGANSEQG